MPRKRSTSGMRTPARLSAASEVGGHGSYPARVPGVGAERSGSRMVIATPPSGAGDGAIVPPSLHQAVRQGQPQTGPARPAVAVALVEHTLANATG